MEKVNFNEILVNNKLFEMGEYIILNANLFDANDVKSFLDLIIKMQKALTNH